MTEADKLWLTEPDWIPGIRVNGAIVNIAAQVNRPPPSVLAAACWLKTPGGIWVGMAVAG